MENLSGPDLAKALLGTQWVGDAKNQGVLTATVNGQTYAVVVVDPDALEIDSDAAAIIAEHIQRLHNATLCPAAT